MCSSDLTKDDGVSTTIDMITGGLGKTMTIENREYEWAVQIDQDHAVNIRYAKYNGKVITATDAAATTAGIGNSPIYLGLEERYFGPGAILSFDNYRFQVRVSGTRSEEHTSELQSRENIVCRLLLEKKKKKNQKKIKKKN